MFHKKYTNPVNQIAKFETQNCTSFHCEALTRFFKQCDVTESYKENSLSELKNLSIKDIIAEAVVRI